ncbi:SCO family protein [Oricola cellulosilytica]|uniref:SCO family protein n=2 Tax=Oricola cellulosilytica TaxID=1429082 RepID=A0A4V2MNU3_9HYPH|nr:SCO family protein [Oricola cellulosilytica]
MAVIAVLAVLLAGGMAVIFQQFVAGRSDQLLTSGGAIGAPFELVDHNGEPITEQAMEGRPVAVFFGFAHCPEVCPTTLYEMAGWLNALGEEGEEIGAFFVTVDPERDTPEIMRAYVTNFTDRITGITGDPEKVAALTKSWFVYSRKVPLDDGGYTMDHTASIYLVGRDGNFKGTIAYGENGETAVAKLRRLVKG